MLPAMTQHIAGFGIPLVAIPIFGAFFGVLLVIAGGSRLVSLRRAETTKDLAGGIFWGAVGILGGAWVSAKSAYWLVRYLSA